MWKEVVVGFKEGATKVLVQHWFVCPVGVGPTEASRN